MLLSDIFVILQWWATLFLIGILFLPLTSLLFRPFFDRGYIFSKLIGLIITSYFVFILGLLHISYFSALSSYIILFSVVIILFLVLRKRENVLKLLKEKKWIFIFEELLFLACLFFWTYIHSFSPDIHGLEKYMDFGFINSILRADFFPPKDMWFTPFFINYYYFGHLMTAVMTKLSALPSNLTYNLMLSTISAFCFTQGFSIVANLFTFIDQKIRFFNIKRIIAGIISALLLTFGGNLHVLYAFFKAYPNESPVPIWTLPFLPFSFPNSYWYPNATRFIDNTIHEFPIYSWVVADLHGHVLDIPVVLLIIGVLFSLFLNKTTESQTTNLKIGYLLTVSFLLSAAYMTNAWDGAIYFLLTFCVIIYLYTQKFFDYKKIIISTLIVLAGFLVFTLPYNMSFKPFASGIGVLCSPDFLVSKEKLGPLIFEKDHCQHSPWWQLIMLYGFFYFFVITFLIFTMRAKKLFQVDQFVLLLIILSTILILLPEFIYVKDIYPAHYRANTMFKLVFQAFIMLSLTSGYIIARILTIKTKKIFSIFYFVITFSLVSVVMLYPYQAISSYYGNLNTYSGLNGTKYLETLYPSDFAAIEWINKNIKGQPVILEAQGDSYTDYARVSSNTGLPTVLGWTVHEWLWRGTYNIPAPRINEIKTMYETEDTDTAKKLLTKYKVAYVFIGSLEHDKYPNLQEEKFEALGKVVFQKNNTKIYKLN